LPLQVLPLPPWLVLVFVVNPVFSPAASAALEANANEPTSKRAEISRVMGFLLCRQNISLDLALCGPSRPSGPVPSGLICKRSYLHCPAGPSHVDDDVVELLWPPLFCVVVVVLVVVVHPGLLLQGLVLPPWPLVVVVVVVVVNPVLFSLVLSASAALEANANEPASRRAEISGVVDRVVEFLLCWMSTLMELTLCGPRHACARQSEDLICGQPYLQCRALACRR
jgi:hypothetical protein